MLHEYKHLITGTERVKTSNAYALFETKNISNSNDIIWETRIYGAIINHGTVTNGPFLVGETITGGTSGKTGTITDVQSGYIVYDTHDNGFTDGETITGGTSNATAAVTNHNTGADSYYDYNTSSVKLQTGTVSGQRVVRQTTRYFPYFPLYEQGISQTYNTELVAGKDQYFIYGDDNNGIGIYANGLAVYVLIRSNTSGSPVDKIIPQSRWLDGKNLDFNKAQLQSVHFLWLGYGNVQVKLNAGGREYTVTDTTHAGITEAVYMRTPTLPVRYEIKNTTTTAKVSELSQVCCSVYSEGGFALPGLEFSAGIKISAKRAITTLQPVFAIRLKSEFPTGKPNRKTIRFLDYSVTTQTNNATAYLIHAHDPITITGGTWVSSSGASGVEYNTGLTALTAKHLHEVQRADVLAGQAGKGGSERLGSETINNHSYASQNYESDNSQMFVIFAEAETGTADISCHISWIEFE